MNANVAEAVRLGQQMSCGTCSAYQHHCVDLALDEILRHPDADGAPRDLLAKALAHARTHLRRRASICRITSGSNLLENAQIAGGEALTAEQHAVIEIDDWLRRSQLSSDQQLLLRSQLLDLTPESLGQVIRVPVARLRERLSRARRAARRELAAVA